MVPKKTEKLTARQVLTYLTILSLIPIIYTFGQDTLYSIVKKPVMKCVNKEILIVKKELDTQRHNDMVQISQLLMAIPEIRLKAERMKSEKNASSTILEALE